MSANVETLPSIRPIEGQGQHIPAEPTIFPETVYGRNHPQQEKRSKMKNVKENPLQQWKWVIIVTVAVVTLSVIVVVLAVLLAVNKKDSNSSDSQSQPTAASQAGGGGSCVPETTPASSLASTEGIYIFGGAKSNTAFASTVIRLNPTTNEVFQYGIPFQHWEFTDEKLKLGTYTRLWGSMNAGALKNGSIMFSSYSVSPWKGYGMRMPSAIDGTNVKQIFDIPYLNYYPVAITAGNTYVNCGRNASVLFDLQTQCIMYNAETGNYMTMDVDGNREYTCLVTITDSTVLWIPRYASGSVLRIDVNRGEYENIATLPNHRSSAGCALYGTNTVVICGGLTTGGSSIYTSTCITLLLDTLQWGEFPSMNIPRYGLRLVNWQGRLYAIGGTSGTVGHTKQIQTSIEYYDGSAWRNSTMQLPEKMYQFGAAVVQP